MKKIQCTNCGEIIEGDGKGTLIQCKCKSIAIDETEYYYRIIGNTEDFKIIDDEETEKVENKSESAPENNMTIYDYLDEK